MKRKVIGFCCSTMNKEPARPLLNSLCKLVLSRKDLSILCYHCFEDLYMDSPYNKGAAKIFDTINYDLLEAMVFLQYNEQQKPLFMKVAEKCKANNVPVIYIDEHCDGAFNIRFEYGDAFGQLVEHIITHHGCKRIKHVAGMRNNAFSQGRIDSCAEVMARHGLTLEEKDIMYGEFWEEPTFRVMDEFFASGEPLPDAFVCANDSMAMSVCAKLAEKGYRVPRDVIVTGFDGIEFEQYHDPRLCTAVRDNDELAEAIISVVDEIIADPAVKPHDVMLCYTPVFSESCGCVEHNGYSSNRNLSEYVRNYSYAKGYESHIIDMVNLIAENNRLDKIRQILKEFSLSSIDICVTEDYYSYLTAAEDDVVSDEGGDGYSETMYRFVNCEIENQIEIEPFLLKDVVPDLEKKLNDYVILVILPLHSQDKVIGYYSSYFLSMDFCKDQQYTYTVMLNQCLENIRTQEHMRQLNRKMEFMFTHDQLTKIYNRYGFYKNFRESFLSAKNCERDVFIASVDLNGMKYINDTFGHQAGDEALRITATALANAAEKIDSGIICSRFGGDEFVVAKICSGNAHEFVQEYRLQFEAVLAALNATSGNPFTVEVSIGIHHAILNDVDSIDELIELADRLMYTEKARHKRCPKGM